MAEEYRPEDDDRIVRSERPGRGRRGRRLMTVMIAAVAVLGFGVVLVYAYNKGHQDGESRVPPVIQAQDGPTKIRPETPGGMQVPDRDKEVFSRLEADSQTQKVERLLPPPEKPMAQPLPAVVPEKMPEKDTAAAPPSEPAAGSVDGRSTPIPPPAPKMPALAVEPPAMPVPAEKAEPPAPPKAEAKTAAKTPAKTAPAAAAKGAWRVQISSLRSDDAARKAWAALSKKNSDLLGSLSLTVERKDLGAGKGVYYRMQAGPLASRDAANALCGKLKQRKIGCLVVAP